MSVVETLTSPQPGQVAALPVDQVHPSPDNVRSDLGDVSGLAASIKDQGLVQPIVVHPADDGDGWTIIAGHRRHAAHLEAGFEAIDAIVREGPTDVDATAARIIENVQRQDLAPSDEARAYHRLAGLGRSQRQIAEAVGVSQGQVSKRIKLAALPDTALRALDQDRCTVEDLLALCKLTDEDPDAADDLIRAELFRQADFELTRCRQDRKRREALKEAREAHKAGEGPPVHPASDKAPYPHSPYSVRGVEPIGSFGLKDVTREQLQADGTLAVLVDRLGRVHEVCTKPAHYRPETSPSTGRPRDEVAERRQAFVGALMQSDDWEPPAHFRMLITLLTDLVIGSQNSTTLRQAVDWLGLDLKKSASHGELQEALEQLLTSEGRAGNELVLNARKIAQALLWTRAEHWVEGGTIRHGHAPANVLAYLDQIVAAGYEPTDDEAAALEADEDGDADG